MIPWYQGADARGVSIPADLARVRDEYMITFLKD